MAVILNKKREKAIWGLYGKWSRKFLKEVDPKAFKDYDIDLEAQVELIANYVAIKSANQSDEQFEAIKRFLRLQDPDEYKDHKQIWLEGQDGYDYLVIVDDTRDVDFADIHGLIESYSMFVYREDGLEWDGESAEAFIAGIGEDLEYDYETVNLVHEVFGNMMFVYCEVGDEMI